MPHSTTLLFALLVSAGASASAAADPGVTDTEVVLGQSAAFSGPSAGLGVEMWRGATAAFSLANEKGVFGRKVRLIAADDGYDAERAAATVLKLITKDKVFALFGGVGTPTIVKALPVVLKYYKDEGLFYFANFTGAQPQREPPYERAVFNVRTSYRLETKAAVDAFVAMGRKKIGIFVQDDAYGASGRDGIKRALAEHSLQIAADTTYPRGQLFDVANSEQVKVLAAAAVDAIIMVGAYQACAGMVRDLRTSGITAPIDNVSFVGADQMLALLAPEEKKGSKKLTANLLNTQVVPFYDDVSVPAVRDYRSAIAKYAPSAPVGVGDGNYKPGKPHSFGSLEGFISARAFLVVLDKTGAKLTRQSFFEAAEKLGRFDLGVGVPAELSPTRHQALDKVWWTYAATDKWKPVDDPSTVIK